jgi:hypothetical protein
VRIQYNTSISLFIDVVRASKAVPLNAKQLLWGRGGIAYTHSWLWQYMGVSGQHHASAALYRRGKDPRYPLEKRLSGPQSWSGYRLEENFFASAGDRTPVVQSVVTIYTGWATPTLTWVWCMFKIGIKTGTEQGELCWRTVFIVFL